MLLFPSNHYRTIVADPPWPECGGGKIRRGANQHYELMTVKQIAALPVVKLAHPDGCHLYLWATNNYLPDGLDVLKAWGFEYVTIISWAKVNAQGESQIGLGQYFRGATEHVLFGRRGVLPYQQRPDGKRAQGRTLILAPRQEHSRKPQALRDMAELVSPGPRIELFAREKFPGWDVWGNQAPEHDEQTEHEVDF